MSGIAHWRSALTSRAACSGDALAAVTPGIVRVEACPVEGLKVT